MSKIESRTKLLVHVGRYIQSRYIFQERKYPDLESFLSMLVNLLLCFITILNKENSRALFISETPSVIKLRGLALKLVVTFCSAKTTEFLYFTFILVPIKYNATFVL